MEIEEGNEKENIESKDFIKVKKESSQESTNDKMSQDSEIVNIDIPNIPSEEFYQKWEEKPSNLEYPNLLLKHLKLNEKYKIDNFINSGSVGYIYTGIDNSNKNKKYCFKFCINKRRQGKRSGKNIDNLNSNEKIEKDENNRNCLGTDEDDMSLTEITNHKNLFHKNINRVYAFYKNDSNSFFFITDLGMYGDLQMFKRKVLKRETLTETFICYIIKQCLEGLEYIHRCKIIHMDIKLDNIVFDGELIPKIIDFSASSSYRQFNDNDIVRFPFIGTGKYIAPEIIDRCEMKISEAEKIDLYSLGIMAYKLAYNTYPYNLTFSLKEMDNKKDLYYKRISENVKTEKLNFPENKKISNKFKDFLRGIINPNYKQRITIRQALHHEWIKGWEFIEEERQNIGNQENFLIRMITDTIIKFNEYIKSE